MSGNLNKFVHYYFSAQEVHYSNLLPGSEFTEKDTNVPKDLRRLVIETNADR